MMKKIIKFKEILLVALILAFLFSTVYFGYKLKQDIKEKKTNDSLKIVKLKLEIEKLKLE